MSGQTLMKFGGYPSRDKSCALEKTLKGYDIRINSFDGGERSRCVVFLGKDEFESYMHLLTMLDLLYYERSEQYVRIDAYTTYWYMNSRGRKYLVFTQSGNPALAWVRADYVETITAWFVRELKAKDAAREAAKQETAKAQAKQEEKLAKAQAKESKKSSGNAEEQATESTDGQESR